MNVVHVWYGSGTVDRIASEQVVDAAAHVAAGDRRTRDAACALTRCQHFSVVKLRHGRRLESMTSYQKI